MALFGRPTAEDDRKAQEWAEWFAQRNPLAIASLVLGVFSLIEFGALIVFGIAGIALGIVALVQLARAACPIASARPESSPTRDQLGPMDYADRKVPEVVNALVYERPPIRPLPNKGQALAWSGIALSAASLLIAAALYLRVFG